MSTIRDRDSAYTSLEYNLSEPKTGREQMAADRRSLLAAGDALAQAFEMLAARFAVQTGLGASEWEAILWPEGRAALISWKVTAG
jgi:hypothetical protein